MSNIARSGLSGLICLLVGASGTAAFAQGFSTISPGVASGGFHHGGNQNYVNPGMGNNGFGVYNPNQINGYGVNNMGVTPVAPTGYTVNPAFGAPYGVPGYIAAPVPVGGSNFSFRMGNVNANFWRAPSGYYYPFNSFYNPFQINTIYVDPSSQEPPIAKAPPLSVQFSDTFKFLDDVKKDQKISDADYERLKRRTTDIQNKERSLRIAQGGSLDPEYQSEIRRDMDTLANEIIGRVKK